MSSGGPLSVRIGLHRREFGRLQSTDGLGAEIAAQNLQRCADAGDGERDSLTRCDESDCSGYCTFTALICKLLIINGAGEGNRTLVSTYPI
jgi:hypothetical protein